jgi:anti-anti-sigma factor
MNVNVRTVQGVTVVALEGELVHPWLEDARARVLAAIAPRCKMVLDLSGVTDMGSGGLRLLKLAHMELEDKGGSAVLVGVRPEIREILTVTGYDDFPCCDTLDAGIGRLSA